MSDSRDEKTVVATADESSGGYSVPVGAGGLAEGESREIVCHKHSRDDEYEAILAKPSDGSKTIPLFIFEDGAFAYGYVLPVTSQIEMTPNRSIEHISLQDRDWHLEVASTGLVAVVVRYESNAANKLDLSALPEAPQPKSETALLVAFDASGSPVFIEPFVSGVTDLDISQDGQYISVLTSFPDIVTYLYTGDGQYLGSSLGRGTELDCSFVSHADRLPKLKLDGPNMSPTTLAVNGEEFGAIMPDDLRLVQDSSEGPIHVIVPESLPESTDNLRLNGIEVESACGKSITPLSSHLVFDSQREADEAEAAICKDCSEATGPAEKFEERRHEM